MPVRLGCLPNRQQQLLLRAALLEGDASFDAWRQWCNEVDIEYDIDGASYRLLPMVYRNLSRRGFKDPSLNKPGGVYRRTFYQNSVLFHRLSAVLRVFRAHGIEAILLKGAALVLLYYRDLGLRPMNDIDILVKPEDARRAAEHLCELGWKPDILVTRIPLRDKHSATFRSLEGLQIDLHWHALLQCCRPGADDDFWSGAIQVTSAGLEYHVLNPADQILQVFAHGVEWNTLAPIRWVSDGATIIRSAGEEINWHRLVEQAADRQLVAVIKEMLAYLRGTLNVGVPDEVLQELTHLPTTVVEQTVYMFMSSAPSLGRLIVKWYLHSNTGEGRSLARRLAAFPGYLRSIWGLDSVWQIPGHVARRAREHRLRTRKKTKIPRPGQT